MTDTYEPKHMVYRETVLSTWQAQCHNAATNLSLQKLEGMDAQVWAFLRTMGESRDLCEAFFDYGVTDDYEPKHLAKPLVGNITRFCPECASKVFITKRVCFGADPHNEYRCTACSWTGRKPGYSI